MLPEEAQMNIKAYGWLKIKRRILAVLSEHQSLFPSTKQASITPVLVI